MPARSGRFEREATRTPRAPPAAKMSYDELTDEAMFRLGTAIAGAFVGALVGVLAFLPLNLIGVVVVPFMKAAMAGAASGGLCGAAVPRLAMAALEGTIQFFFG